MRKPPDSDSSNFKELFNALLSFNSRIANPLRGPRQLALKLDARGETLESMEEAFSRCRQNSQTPVKAFYAWIQKGDLANISLW